MEAASGDIPIILVGSKVDAAPMDFKITKDQLGAMAERFRCPLYVASAKTGQNVARVFEELCETVVNGAGGGPQAMVLQSRAQTKGGEAQTMHESAAVHTHRNAGGVGSNGARGRKGKGVEGEPDLAVGETKCEVEGNGTGSVRRAKQGDERAEEMEQRRGRGEENEVGAGADRKVLTENGNSEEEEDEDKTGDEYTRIRFEPTKRRTGGRKGGPCRVS